MNFKVSKYSITKSTEQEFEVVLIKTYVLLELAFATAVFATFFVVLYDQINLTKIGLVEVILGILVITYVYNLRKSIKLLLEGERYNFNKTLNSISKNGQTIRKLNELYSIQIREHKDSESATLYELQFHFDFHDPICLQKSTNLETQKAIGNNVSRISGIPFNYQNETDVISAEQQKKQQETYQEHVALFENQYQKKGFEELLEIVKEDSPYADYAKEAANNLINQHPDKIKTTHNNG